MPELPEVETVLKGLGPVLSDAVICHAQITRQDLRYPFPFNFCQRLIKTKIIALGRRAKYLIIGLDSRESLIIHLGMSGRVKILATPEDLKPHDHVILILSNGYEVRYHDPRRFGFMDLVSTAELQSYRSFKELGPEPLSPQFNENTLLKVAASRQTPLKSFLLDQKSFLLDQKVVAGLGNIYVCEALFLAKLSPCMPVHRLTKAQAGRLMLCIQNVLKEAIKAGGSTLRDHAQPNGEMGYFQHQFKVYGREAQPCIDCNSLIQRSMTSGRSTFFCSKCQGA